MLATSSNNDSDPDYIADGLSDQQNRRELQTLAEACDRYQISDRSGAAIASSVLVDFGFITRDKMQNTTSILTIFHQKREKELISPMESIRRVCGTELENRLSLVKADGTNSLNYLICCSIITSDVDNNLALLEVDPINHSHWLAEFSVTMHL
ncbi:hypothetical protein Anas_11653 [Armadillidium nasatum]|uniref:Uncharacterized protein n=1 Tax=Armadillidium nasatum TaxID=96803 RepID=A0A5N5T4G3_9CRUS|nr:hypothetical protein Anas_11653 [Armadillidium nasatum]